MIAREAASLRYRPMHPSDPVVLAPRIQGADLTECLMFGYTAQEALARGDLAGPAFTAYSPARAPGDWELGCCGVTEERVLWSLWREDLLLNEQLQVMRMMPKAIEILREAADLPHAVLFNWVHESNERAIRWLEATRLFTLSAPVVINGQRMIPFQTKELP